MVLLGMLVLCHGGGGGGAGGGDFRRGRGGGREIMSTSQDSERKPFFYTKLHEKASIYRHYTYIIHVLYLQHSLQPPDVSFCLYPWTPFFLSLSPSSPFLVPQPSRLLPC